MLGKLHLICMKTKRVFMQIRCNFSDISYFSETIAYLSKTQKNKFQFLNNSDTAARTQYK